MAIYVRNGREDEARELAQIGFGAWKTAVTGWAQEQALEENAANAFLNFTRREWLAIDVAEVHGELVGWAAREKLDNKITDLWIAAEWQRRGVGRMLLEHMEKEILEHGYEVAELETHADNNAALSFFRACGYSLRWMTTVYSAKLDRDVDTVGLSKELIQQDEVGTYGLE